MVGSPLGRRCEKDGSICSKLEGKQFEGRLPTSALSSKKDAQMLKNNSAFSTKVLHVKEIDSIRESRSTATSSRNSFLSPTISSSRKTNTENQKGYPVQVLQTKLTVKKGSESQPIKMTQVKDTPAPRRAPLPPIAKTIKKTSAPPQVLHEKMPIHTSINQSQPTTRHTKSSILKKNSSVTQLSRQKTESKPSVHQSKPQTPTSQLSSQRTHNHNSASQSEPPKQYDGRSGTQKTAVPPYPAVRKTAVLPSTSQSKSSTSKNEPIYYIMWQGPYETFHSPGISCTLCEKDLSYMPDDYANEYDDYVEHSVLPTAAILPCGHSFHSVCLDGITPEENSGDPPCFLCLSCMS